MSTVDELLADREAICRFQTSILDWYTAFKRDLPWRGERDPYRILVSEVMLQQTGVDRVIPKYLEFLEQFPTFQSLAQASTGDVLRAWQGLGYNRRAVNLKRLAEVVVHVHNGVLPSEPDVLRSLPGIGRYTAHAVACFAFGLQVPVVDTNIRRVLASFAGRELSEQEVWQVAEAILPAGRAEDWNQALMDYGALVQKAPRRRSTNVQPFATSDRFWRGRIIDVLRDQDRVTIDGLLDELPHAGRDEGRVRALVHALHEEGMLLYDVDADRVELPP